MHFFPCKWRKNAIKICDNRSYYNDKHLKLLIWYLHFIKFILNALIFNAQPTNSLLSTWLDKFNTKAKIYICIHNLFGTPLGICLLRNLPLAPLCPWYSRKYVSLWRKVILNRQQWIDPGSRRGLKTRLIVITSSSRVFIQFFFYADVR